MRPIIAVTDATGLLGGAVARAILNDPQQRFRLRALVRDSSNSATQFLVSAGADVVATDFHDATSVLRAFRGAAGVFAVTDYWAQGSPESEMAQARAMATAARLADVEHVIWSTEQDTRKVIAPNDVRFPTLLQRYKVPPFDAKGESDQFFAASGVPVTFLRTALLWERLLEFGMGPRRAADGSLRLAMPLGERPIAGIAVADVGSYVVQLFAEGAPSPAQRLTLAAEEATGPEIAAAFGRALGEAVTFDSVPWAQWRKRELPGSAEQASMFHFLHDRPEPFCLERDAGSTRVMSSGLQSLDEWMTAHRAFIPTV